MLFLQLRSPSSLPLLRMHRIDQQTRRNKDCMPISPPSDARRPAAPSVAATSTPVLTQLMTSQHSVAPGIYQERRQETQRRSHSAWSFLYGGFRPRRRNGRRDGDEYRVHFDWHEPAVLYLALAIVLMSCADALFTLNILTAGGEELNAFMAALLGFGTDVFLWTKIALTGTSIVCLAAVARRRVLGRVPVMWLLRLFLGMYVVLIGWELYLLGWHATSTGPLALAELRAWVAG